MSIKAMKQVIELYDKHCHNNDYGGIEFNNKHGYKFIEAIEALRTAIQQAEAQQPATGEPFGYIHHFAAHDERGALIDTTWEADGCADPLPHPTFPAMWKWAHCAPFYTTPQPAQATQAEVTDEQIKEAAVKAVKDGKLSWLGFEKDDQDKYTIPVISKSHYQFARAILALRPEPVDFPAGAIVNGRTLMDRIEAYPFESEGGDLRMCSDWHELRRCFEHLADYVSSRPAPSVPMTPRELELIDGMIAVQLDHAQRCDAISNRDMAEKQKGWDMERVELLRRIRSLGITAHAQKGSNGKIS